MANTFSQIYIQTVFAVSNRQSLIKPEFKKTYTSMSRVSLGIRARSPLQSMALPIMYTFLSD